MRVKTCTVCGATKQLDAFVRYRTECLECRATAKTCTRCNARKPLDDFYVNHRGPDGRMHHCKACILAAKSAGPRDKARARDSARRAQRNERLRRRRLTDPAWAESQRERARQRHQRLVTQGATVHALAAEAGWICYLCGQEMGADEPLEVDHIVPVSLGGPDARGNVAATHRACNRRKSNVHPFDLDWVAETARPVIATAVQALASVYDH